MSGDHAPPKPGERAPRPDDGTYKIVAINADEQIMEVEWVARGLTFRCWVPQDAFEIHTTH